ncbi:MAG: polysaccharide deacetylase family protein [Acidobacteriaceae bacterium]
MARVGSGEIALTFGNGPNGGTTKRLLEVLDEAQVRATFFLIGRYGRHLALGAEQGHTVEATRGLLKQVGRFVTLA